MRILLLILFLLSAYLVESQEIDVKSQLIETFKNSSERPIPSAKRRLMFKQSDSLERVGVLKVSFAGLMYLYQNIISEQISASCMYEISCSEYTKQQIERNGIFLGSIKGFNQLMHCTHGAIEEVPHYMRSNYSDKIKNSIE